MILDIKTLLLLNVVIHLTNALVLSLFWHQNHKKIQGITFLLMNMILQAGGLYLISLHEVIPDLLSVVFGSALLTAGFLLVLVGMQKFFEMETRQLHNYFLVLVYVLLLVYFSAIDPSWKWIEIILSAAVLLLNAQIFYLLYFKVDSELRTLARISGMVFLAYAMISLIRIIVISTSQIAASDLFETGRLSTVSLTVYMVLSILITTGFVLLINRRLMIQVESQERKYISLFTASPYAMFITRLSDGRIMEVNSNFTSLMGYTAEDVIGKTTLSLNMWAGKEEKNQQVEKISEFKKIKGLELELRKKNGLYMTGLVSSEIIYIYDVKCILTSISDITEISMMKKVLQEIAMHDALTKLPNRLLFHDRLDVAISNAQRGDKILAVVFIDIDYLKVINDQYGHEMGDKVLIAVGNIFKYAVRKVDTVARFGGDEFVLLLWDVGNRDNVVKIIKNIQDKFIDPVQIDENEFKISLSIGISIFPEDGNVRETLIGNADKAMYQVKESGRGNFRFYMPEEDNPE